jgi:hypothetical protein
MNNARKAALVALAAGLAACGDGAVVPRSDSPETAAVNGGGSMESLTGSDTVKFNITIDPSRQTYYYLGDGNSVTFPAHSLCDLKSSYGADQWDKPCAQATQPVTVAVKAWLDGYGHPRVDFGTHLRFVPSANPAQWVKVVFGDLQASSDPYFTILYCTTAASDCFDEGKLDPTLATVHDPITGKVTRRIKHFSGYNVAAGDDGFQSGSPKITPPPPKPTPTPKPASSTTISANTLMPVIGTQRSNIDLLLSDVLLRRFAGYMLASG